MPACAKPMFRFGIGRPSARLEQIEMSWEERKHKGHEAVYQATFQANRYFQKWNKGAPENNPHGSGRECSHHTLLF